MYLWNFHWFRTLIGYCLEDSKRLQEIRLMLLQWAHCVANAPWTCWLKSLALKISVGNSTAGQLDSPVYVKAYFSLFFNWSRASQVSLVVKNPPANAGDLRDKGLIPGLGRFPGGGNGNPLQYSFLENPMDRGAWRATVHGVAESDMTEVT